MIRFSDQKQATMKGAAPPTLRLFRARSLALCLIAAVTSCSAVPFDVNTQSKVDDVIQAGMSCKHFPGLAAAVVKDGEVLMSEGYGLKDKETQHAVTSDTLFQIASLTKAFTAALLANILEADSHLKISTTLHSSKVLPDDFKFNNSLRTTYATFEDLLAHRTGVPRNSMIRLATDYSTDTIASKLRYLPTYGAFRDSFYYNDLMYGLVSHITERLGHGTWQHQVKEMIFRPLGMNRSTFISDVNFDTDDVATPYVTEHGHLVKASIDFIKHWGRNGGSGSIFSSANDMAQWMLMLLNDGKDRQGARVLMSGVMGEVLKASNVVPPASYSATYRRPMVPESFSGDTYGLGWKLGYYRGFRMVYHSGTTFAYRAFLTLLPEMNVGVVSLMTGTDDHYSFRTPLHEYLMDVALGYTPWIDSTSICTFPDPWKSAFYTSGSGSDEIQDSVAEDETDEEILLGQRQRDTARETRIQAHPRSLDDHAFTGTFHHGAYGDLIVRYNTSTLHLQLEYGIGQWQLAAASGSEYRFSGQWLKDYPSLCMDFLFHADGRQIISVEAVDFDSHTPPVFFRKLNGGNSGPPIG